MGQVLHLNSPRTVDEAWQRFDVAARAQRDLYADPDSAAQARLDACKDTVRAWDEWSKLFLAEEQAK